MASYTYYLATHFPNRQMANIVVQWLDEAYHSQDGVDAVLSPVLQRIFGDICLTTFTCNARWLQEDLECDSMRDAAGIDFTDVREADFLIALSPLGYGSTAEVAYAHGQGKPVIVLTDVSEFDCEDHENLILNLLEPVEAYDPTQGKPPVLEAYTPDQLLQGVRIITQYLEAAVQIAAP